MRSITFLHYNEEKDEEYEVSIPAEWAICGGCRGDGTRTHPALSVWTASDRAEDPEGFQRTMRGDYDVSCADCRGLGRVLVPAEDALAEDLDAYRQHLSRQEPCPIQMAEVRMGA